MADLDAAAVELERAFEALQSAVGAGAPAHVPASAADAMEALNGATARLLEGASNLTQDLENLQDSMQAVADFLQGDEIAEALTARVSALAAQATSTLDSKQQAFESLSEELSDSADEEIRDWMTEAVESLSTQLDEGAEQVGQVAEEAIERLAGTLKAAVEKVGDDLVESVKDRCSEALDSVVDAAVGQALNEVAETLITTQIGTTITSAIGPYLPAVIALRRSVGAIQSALDAMRMGL